MVDIISNIPYNYPHIFSVVFTKKDGSLRHMTCRRGVISRSKGVAAGNDKPFAPSYNFTEKRLLSVFDVNKEKEITGEDKKGAYRSVNWDTVCQIKIEGTTYRTSEFKEPITN